MYYKIVITETASNRPSNRDTHIFDEKVKEFKTIEEVKEFLTEHYGNFNTKRLRKIYVDKADGTVEEVGCLKSFWNNDCCHNSKSWWQTDWISIFSVNQKAILI